MSWKQGIFYFINHQWHCQSDQPQLFSLGLGWSRVWSDWECWNYLFGLGPAITHEHPHTWSHMNIHTWSPAPPQPKPKQLRAIRPATPLVIMNVSHIIVGWYVYMIGLTHMHDSRAMLGKSESIYGKSNAKIVGLRIWMIIPLVYCTIYIVNVPSVNYKFTTGIIAE